MSKSPLEKSNPVEDDSPFNEKNRSAFFAFIKNTKNLHALVSNGLLHVTSQYHLSDIAQSLRSFKGDLNSITAPPFILSTTSTTESVAYWSESPSLFVAPVAESDPERRALLVLKWFLSTLKQQYSHRDGKGGRSKKPLNPFLGELFFGSWHDEAGETKLVSEQVSHHPPTTAYRIWNEQHGVSLDGYFSQDVRFRGTVCITRLGHAVLHLDKYDENYLFTLPSMHLEGIIPPPPYVELDKHTFMQSSTGFTAKIDYSGKGWLKGKKNSFSASLYRTESPKDFLYSAEGQWTEKFIICDAKSRSVVESFSSVVMKSTTLTVKPLEQQSPLESRKAWQEVVKGIEANDMNAVATAKSKIENEQREQRKREQTEGREWQRKHFKRVGKHESVEALGEKIGYKPEGEKTGGIWLWDESKWKENSN